MKQFSLVLSQQTKRVCPFLSCTSLLDTERPLSGHLRTLFWQKSPSSSILSSQERHSTLGSFLWPFPGHTPISLCLSYTPHLDTVLQVRSHQHRAEGQDHLPHPASHTSFDAVQDTVGFLGCEGTSLAHVQPAIHQYPQVFFCRAAFNPFISQLVLVVRVASTQV